MSEADQVQSETAPVTSTAPRRQFYALWMIGVLVVFVVCEGIVFFWSPGGVFGATAGLFLALVFSLLRYCHLRKTFLGALVVVVVAFFIARWSLISTPYPMSDYAWRSFCKNELRQLGFAIHNYHDARKRLPPAFVADSEGRPMHSWRTLVLPFVELNKLYQEYHLDKPWDSPENQAVVAEWENAGLVFKCPKLWNWGLSGQPANLTNYVAVTGDDTVWPADGTTRSFKDVTAGTGNTAMLIEINNSDIPWYEPRDVKLEDLLSGKVSWGETAPHAIKTALYQPMPIRNVLFCDASVRPVYGNLTPDQIRRLFSITEPFDVERELISPAPRPIVYRHVVFYGWLATLLLQLVYIFFPVEKRVRGADPE